MPASSAGLPLVIESWMYGRATSRSAAIVASRLRNSDACVSAAGATIAAVSPSSCDERARSPVSGAERFRITGTMSRSSGRNAPIAVLIDSPRPANAVPKPSRLACDGRPRLLVEHVQELVELDRRLGLRERDRVAVLRRSGSTCRG